MVLSHRHLVLGVCIFIAIFNQIVSSQTTNHDESVTTLHSGSSSIQTHNEGGGDTPDPSAPPGFSIAPGINLITEDQSGLSVGPTGAFPTSIAREVELLVGGGAREGYFSPGAKVELFHTLPIHGYTSLSFRTCSHGTFLYQIGDNSDSVSLSLDENGILHGAFTRLGNTFIATIPHLKLNNNQWHRLFLKYDVGTLYLGVDSASTVVANTTGLESELLQLNLWSSNPKLVIGGGLAGCFLEGANTLLSANDSMHFGVDWEACSLPLGRNCSGYLTDPCFMEPCGSKGVCIPAGEEFTCDCYTRYSGTTCQLDSGPLCQRDENQCQNEGVCQEDRIGNSTHCACPTGFMGSYCENTVVETCTSNPCSNNGTCVLSQHQDQFACLCPPGFTGEYCEVEDDVCSFEPCLHEGTCSLVPNGFSCNCTNTGYRGDLCQENIDECYEFPSPCVVGSACYDLYGTFECVCYPGYSGEDCLVEINECLSSPCQNGGACTDGLNDYLCDCPRGFEGKNCHVNVDDCLQATCPDNAVCVDGIDDFECRCQPGYSGSPPNCEKINQCDSNPCLNGATCFFANEGHTCICPLGFTGLSCETNIDDCTNIYCENQGSCVDGINNHTCVCLEGFTGTLCERNLNECAQNVCAHAVRCTDLNGDYSCECEAGWTGKNCDEEVDECRSDPCHNNGTCVDRVGGFVCNCVPGFEGELCDINIDECASSPCQNNGTCIDAVSNYTCVCPDGFMGRDCQDIYDACANSPCFNGASCITTPGERNHYCECLPGFEGLDCSNNINECSDIACLEGKVCFDLINSYECRCPEGFSGDTCSININECDSNPCQNGGTCHDATANYTCVCPLGYTGHNCEEDVDECVLLSPCLNGICLNTNGSYQCYCRPGFSGSNCSLEFDECLYKPCKNGGTCINMINSYQCQCPPGFTGSDCETDIDECLSQPCQNNATCVDGIANFTCQCVPGFTDLLCATNIDECESNPCQNGGGCEDGVNMYECNCTETGFKGDHCEINIDDCESSPCQHGSNCTDLIKDYNCSCYDGYTGKNCEEDIPECASSPCQNNAECYEYSNMTYYEFGLFSSDFSYAMAGGFLCVCQPGFEGDFCEINIDECENNPCQHGQCIDGINAFVCECLPGYEGIHCEHEIDECERDQPCLHGTCVDKIADYDCDCETAYGGKNCSVLLIGCSDVECVNGGSCVPLLFHERDHDFRCYCVPGFTGRNCELATTLSMDGNAYLILHSQAVSGYNLQMSFRTTLPSVVLAVGQGEDHYFTLVLQEGRLKQHSSFLSRYNGIFSGSELNNGEWQYIQMLVNDTTSLLVANNETTQHSLAPSSAISFTSTFLGGVTSNLKILLNNEPSYTGCMRDVYLNDNSIILETLSDSAKVNVMDGCLREPQCDPNPCQNDGTCVDLWTSFKCLCKRPYLGDTCRMSFTPATFGNEDTRDSLATVNIPPPEQPSFRRYVDISMLVRTRQGSGLIFYLGSPLDSANQLGEEGHSYLLAELIDGHIVIKVRLGGAEEVFETEGPYMASGVPHLLHVERNNDKIYTKVDDKITLNTTLENNGDLLAQILYLGGVPVDSSRVKRQLGVSIITPDDVNNHFKGVLQDIRITAGNETLYVELFPLEVIPDENFNLSGSSLTPTTTHHVLNGTVSDDTCSLSPCLRGNCTITFNDFECSCPTGFKGKICDELEYCAMHSCPSDATCQNLVDGYECVSNGTFDGRKSSLIYEADVNLDTSLYTFSTMYRSKVGGILMAARVYESSVWVGVGPDMIVVQQVNGSATTTIFNNVTILDGNWHSIQVNFSTNSLQVSLDDSLMSAADGAAFVTVNLDSIVRRGGIQIGSAPEELNLDTNLGRQDNTIFGSDLNESALLNPYFRGCISDSRVENILLPFYSPEQLSNNTAANVFNRVEILGVVGGCEVCFSHECENEGQCLDPENTFTCTCPQGFEGPVCEVNIDECLFSECQNNATCVDGIFAYTCHCLPGYEGGHCETEIDECESAPCQNGGTCLDEIAAFSCVCLEEYIGTTCSELKVKNCSNNQCQNGATCNDVFNPLTGIADNYTCDCLFSYNGYNCENEIDFCAIENVHCLRGTCALTHIDKGWKCYCEEGFEGELCSRETDECDPDPCLNGGVCEDFPLAFKCQCQHGWTGRRCDSNINECEDPNLCHEGECIDVEGNYYCDCPELFCGEHCTLENPCFKYSTNCTNGECTYLCDENSQETESVCRCNDGWEGQFCETEVVTLSTEYLSIIIGVVVSLMLLVGIVGLVIFFMMAKKKRETSGTYSPSKQEFYSPRVEMGNMMKPPPEERLI